MPSNEQVQAALDALQRERETFRSAVAATVEQVREYLAAHSSGNGSRAEHAAVALGSFAQGRINADRFSAAFADRQTVDQVTFETMEHALNTLVSLAELEDRLFVVDVEPGSDLREAVRRALEEVGRAYGAARVFELSRTGRYRYSTHARSLGSYPFARWNRTERGIAPPLIVQVDGTDLHVGGLAEFLDGGQKLVLLVRGECAPAPLVRLIMPDTFVMQCETVTDVARLTQWDGAGVAAVVPASAALFVHDPAAGSDRSRRLTISRLPASAPRKALGGLSVAQQDRELRHLKSLAASPAAPAAAEAAAAPGAPPQAPADPVDKLAAWLLSQADLSGID